VNSRMRVFLCLIVTVLCALVGVTAAVASQEPAREIILPYAATDIVGGGEYGWVINACANPVQVSLTLYDEHSSHLWGGVVTIPPRGVWDISIPALATIAGGAAGPVWLKAYTGDGECLAGDTFGVAVGSLSGTNMYTPWGECEPGCRGRVVRLIDDPNGTGWRGSLELNRPGGPVSVEATDNDGNIVAVFQLSLAGGRQIGEIPFSEMPIPVNWGALWMNCSWAQCSVRAKFYSLDDSRVEAVPAWAWTENCTGPPSVPPPDDECADNVISATVVSGSLIGDEGEPFEAVIDVDGLPPITVETNLPDGLALDAQSPNDLYRLHGTNPSPGMGDVTFTDRCSAITLTVMVNPDVPPPCVAPAISSIGGSTHFMEGVFGSVTVAFTGDLPLSKTVTQLPTGLSKQFGERTITISGTATSAVPNSATGTATNECGSAWFDITVSAAPPEPPSCTFFTGNGQSGTVTVPYGGNLALAWGSTGADTGYISSVPPPDIGNVPANGTLTVGNITSGREHKLRLSGPGGENNDCKLDVNVQPPPPPACLSFTANPSTITLGEPTTLSWTTSGASAGVVNPGGIQAALPNGSTVVSPTGDTTYNLSLVNAVGDSTSCNASVVVNPPPPVCECEGKVSQLTLRYLGNEGAQVKVKGQYGSTYHTLFDAHVAANGTFTVNPYTGSVPSGFAGTLGTEIKVYVNGSYHTTIHTSCSQPIGPGLVSGAFVVVSGTSKEHGAPLCSVCNSSPSWSVANGEVIASHHPQGGYHHVDVTYDWTVSGLSGSVQVFWVNGSSTRVKEELPFARGCGQSLTGSISWDSDAEAHHPAHGAHYFARVLAGDIVVYSEELPVIYE